MTNEREALKLALEALQNKFLFIAGDGEAIDQRAKAITAIKEALAQSEQPKYCRGNRLICLETDEYCVIHISGTDRQWVKFPDSHIGVYTNDQVAELFELLSKEPEPWEKFCDSNCVWTDHHPDCKLAEQEPCCYGGIAHDCRADENCRIVKRMKAAQKPPQRPSRSDIKPLTDEEIASIYMNHTDRPMHAQWNFARAIEAKLKEKNT